jgi:hypothetical protein
VVDEGSKIDWLILKVFSSNNNLRMSSKILLMINLTSKDPQKNPPPHHCHPEKGLK